MTDSQPLPPCPMCGGVVKPGAVAIVDGVRCRARRSRTGTNVRRLCDQHGTQPAPHCRHLDREAAS